MTIRLVPIGSLQPHPANPRIGNVEAIRDSIRVNGFYGAVIVQASTQFICAGAHRWQAAQLEGLTEIPADVLDIDDATALRIVAADNRTSDLAGYENELLASLLTDLRDRDGLAGSGYDDTTLQRLLADVASAANAEKDTDADTPPAVSVPKRVTRGDVWAVGPHRVMCGDCRDPDDVKRLLVGTPVNLAVTSPPYADRRVYDDDSGFVPVPPDDYVDWFAPVAANVAAHLSGDGSWLVNIKPSAADLDTSLYVIDLVAAHVRLWGWHLATEFCWERNGVPKQPVLRLKNQFEPVYQFVQDRWKFRPENVRHASDNVPISLGEGSGDTSWHDRQGDRGVIPEERRPRKNGTNQLMSDVQGTAAARGEALMAGWAYPGNRLPTFVSTHEATGHTAAFPVGLPAFLTRLFTDEGDAVFDPFLGSGSTILAAHNTNRIGYGLEISADYCDVTLDRIQRHTGLTPERL